jgi:hypothetical protein
VTLEHFASAGLDPPRHGTGIDVAELGPAPVHSPTDGRFEFVRSTHHYLAFSTDDDVRDFVERVLAAVRDDQARIRTLAKAALREWLGANQGDEAWAEFLAAANKKWATYPKG